MRRTPLKSKLQRTLRIFRNENEALGHELLESAWKKPEKKPYESCVPLGGGSRLRPEGGPADTSRRENLALFVERGSRKKGGRGLKTQAREEPGGNR